MRRHASTDHTPGRPRPRKQRKLLSCTECNRRKQRCDRQRPCYQCKERETECCYPSASSSSLSSTPSAVRKARLGTVEHRDAVTMSQTASGGSTYASTAASHSHERTVDERYGPSSFTHMLSTSSASAILEQATRMSVDQCIDDALAVLGALEDSAPSTAASLLARLPSAVDTRHLFDSYIQHVRFINYPAPIGMLWRGLERCIKAKERNIVSVGDLDSLAITFGAMSLASPELIESTIGRRDGPQRFHHTLMRCLRLRDTLGNPTPATCLGWHLAGRYLLIDGGMTKSRRAAATAVQVAMSVGLHRDADNVAAEDTREELRLLWSLIRYDERTFSSMVELPSCIDDQYCSTLVPPFSSTLPAELASFVRYRSELATLLGRVSQLLRRTSSSPSVSSGGSVDLEQVLLLNEDISRFQQSLPSDDLSTGYSTSIRFMIHTHTLQTRINLLRPFILLDLPAHVSSPLLRHRRKVCRLSCAEAACQDLKMREHLVESETDMLFYDSLPVPMQNPFRSVRWLASLIICGVYSLTHHWDRTSDDEHGASQEQQKHQQRLLRMARGHLDRFLTLADSFKGTERNLARHKVIIRSFIQQARQLERQQQQTVSNQKTRAAAAQRSSAGGVVAEETTSQRVRDEANLPTPFQPSSTSDMSALGDQNLQDLLDAWFRTGAMDSTFASFADSGQRQASQTGDPIIQINAALPASRAPESYLVSDDATFWESFMALMVER